jgi:molybdenum cofactor synthesis domain-containing protein
MKTVPVQEALGMVLCHDLTRIVPGEFKGPAFRKGHIIGVEDIHHLLDMGKENIYVLEMHDGLIHENAAAMRIASAAAGPGITLTDPREGKVNLVAEWDGLLKVKVDALYELNAIEDVVFATIHSNQVVAKGTTLAGTRIIPLTIDEMPIHRIEQLCKDNGPLVEVRHLNPLRVGIITSGSEVYYGRIKDQFGPVVTKKFEELGCPVLRQIFVSDQVDQIVDAIWDLLRKGSQVIAITGGMSVDPDDVTPAGIRAAGGEVVTYGAPVLPGAMFMLAYIKGVPVLGLPGCVMYHKTSIFDLVLPRILAGERLTRKDFIRLSHGGLCVHCDECRYPNCSFGKNA